MIKRTLDVTLMLTESRRYPYVKARLGRPSAAPGPMEVAVPVRLTLDTDWFSRRSERQDLVLAGPPAVESAVGDGRVAP